MPNDDHSSGWGSRIRNLGAIAPGGERRLERERARAAKDVTEADHKLQEAADQRAATPRSRNERKGGNE